MIMTTVRLAIGFTLYFGIAGVCMAATPAQKCAAAKNKAGVKRAAAESKCYRKAYTTGATVDGACLSKAAQKFTDAIAKAEAKGGCVSIGDAPAIEAAVESAGTIVFPGDYCSLTDTPGGCADSLELGGTYAASAVTINN